MKPKKILSAALLFFILFPLSAQPVSEKRSYMRSMPLEKDARLEVINKYGDIHITSWKKDSVYILAEIEAFAPNRSRLDKMIKGIEVSISGSEKLVRAETLFGREITVLLESLKGITEKIIEYESKVRINYFINIPDYVDIDIHNQFGDVSLEDNSGIVSVNLNNGDFKANALDRISELSIDFGDAEINSVRSAKLNTTFSKIIVSQSNELVINSTSSRFELGKAGKADIESRRDKFFIDDIYSISGISYFTDYKIGQLNGNTELDLKYGSFDIESINERFENMTIKSAYSDITAGFDASASFDFEIRHINAFVVLPDNNIKSRKEVLNEDRKEYLITGVIGSGTGSRKLKIDATRGNIYIK